MAPFLTKTTLPSRVHVHRQRKTVLIPQNPLPHHWTNKKTGRRVRRRLRVNSIVIARRRCLVRGCIPFARWFPYFTPVFPVGSECKCWPARQKWRCPRPCLPHATDAWAWRRAPLKKKADRPRNLKIKLATLAEKFTNDRLRPDGDTSVRPHCALLTHSNTSTGVLGWQKQLVQTDALFFFVSLINYGIWKSNELWRIGKRLPPDEHLHYWDFFSVEKRGK